MMRFGLIGTNGAGKSAVSDYLVTKGFQVISLSDFVREEATRLGRTHSRDDLIVTGTELKQRLGKDVLAKKAISYCIDQGFDNVVFDSIRHPSEVSFFKENHVVMIGVDADINIRYQRIASRGKETDAVDFDTFQKQDYLEFSGQSSGQNISSALQACQIMINNNGSFESLTQEIDQVLEHYVAYN